MRTFARTSTVVLAAALLLAAAVSTASAGSLSVANQTIRVTWSSLEAVGPINVRCRVTLEGSFHSRTIVKVARTLTGAITRATIDEANCTNGNESPRNETLPWHLTYEGFAGTLPNITTVFLLLSRMRFRLMAPGICTSDYGIATDNITSRASLNASREITELEPVAGRNRLMLHSGTAFCPPSRTLLGRATVTLLGTTTRIRVTLI